MALEIDPWRIPFDTLPPYTTRKVQTGYLPFFQGHKQPRSNHPEGKEVKVQNLTKSVLIALLAASPLVGAETQYPAADFQPEIIKQDAELIAKHAEAAKSAAVSTPSQSQAAPATPASSAPAAKAEPAAVAAAPKAEESSSLPVILALLAAAGAGFWFLRKPKSCAPVGTRVAPATVAAPPAGNGETGVARYLKSLPDSNGAKETGVARYIKALPAEAPSKSVTGVAKYINTLPEAAKAPAETGVAKYLKNQGLAG